MQIALLAFVALLAFKHTSAAECKYCAVIAVIKSEGDGPDMIMNDLAVCFEDPMECSEGSFCVHASNQMTLADDDGNWFTQLTDLTGCQDLLLDTLTDVYYKKSMEDADQDFSTGVDEQAICDAIESTMCADINRTRDDGIIQTSFECSAVCGDAESFYVPSRIARYEVQLTYDSYDNTDDDTYALYPTGMNTACADLQGFLYSSSILADVTAMQDAEGVTFYTLSFHLYVFDGALPAKQDVIDAVNAFVQVDTDLAGASEGAAFDSSNGIAFVRSEAMGSASAAERNQVGVVAVVIAALAAVL
jgi:hypothetical protein